MEVEEYVRSKDGRILKIVEYCKKTEIKKHSKNIIDLIEVGDYVNGHLVVATLERNICYPKFVMTENGDIYYLKEKLKQYSHMNSTKKIAIK